MRRLSRRPRRDDRAEPARSLRGTPARSLYPKSRAPPRHLPPRSLPRPPGQAATFRGLGRAPRSTGPAHRSLAAPRPYLSRRRGSLQSTPNRALRPRGWRPRYPCSPAAVAPRPMHPHSRHAVRPEPRPRQGIHPRQRCPRATTPLQAPLHTNPRARQGRHRRRRTPGTRSRIKRQEDETGRTGLHTPARQANRDMR